MKARGFCLQPTLGPLLAGESTSDFFFIRFGKSSGIWALSGS